MERNPHLLDVVLSQLPDGSFSKLTKPPPTAGPPTAGRKKKHASPAISDVTDDAMSSMLAKNIAMAKKIEYLLDDILETDHNILKLLKMKKQQESWMEEL
eukprot:10867988-Ditylum_brightwellii.AAC.1